MALLSQREGALRVTELVVEEGEPAVVVLVVVEPSTEARRALGGRAEVTVGELFVYPSPDKKGRLEIASRISEMSPESSV